MYLNVWPMYFLIVSSVRARVILKYKRLKFAAVCIDAFFFLNTALIRKKKLQLSSVIVRQVNLTGLFITSRVKFKCSPNSSY